MKHIKLFENYHEVKLEHLDESLSQEKKNAENMGAKDYTKKTGAILHYDNGQYLIELDEFIKLSDGSMKYKPIKIYKGYQIKLNKNGVYLYSIFKGKENLEDRLDSIKKCEEIIDSFKES